MVNSLILISTPSQAFFLSQTPKITETAVLLLTVKSKKEIDGILKYLKNFNWKEIVIWFVPNAGDKMVYFKLLQLRLKLLRLELNYPNITQIFFGSYANIIHLSVLAVYEKKAEIMLLYDGLQLVSVNFFRNKLSTENRKKFPIAYRLLGFQEPIIERLTYISPIKLKTVEPDNIRVIKSSIEIDKQPTNENLIFFIGQPLSGIGMISKEYYINTLKILKNVYSKEIIYFPHPREDNNLIEELSKLFEIKKPRMIFEEYYLQLENIPDLVISLYSSVLVNLIFLGASSKMIAIEIPDNEIRGFRFKKLTDPIYEYFRNISNEKFQVLDLDTMDYE